MLIRFFSSASTRVAIGAFVAGAVTVGAAGAATFHRLTVTQTTGSGGATTFVQNSPTSSALQGEVGSAANTSIAIPFGVLGEYNSPGSTFGIGTAGLSTTGYGVGGESFGASPSIIGVAGGTGPSIEASASTTSQGSPFEAVADNASAAAVMYANGGGTGVFALSASPSENSNPAIEGRNASLYSSALVAINVTSTPGPSLDAGGGIYTTAEGPGVFAESAADPPLTGVMDCNNFNGDTNGEDDGLADQTCAGLYIIENGNQGYPLKIYNPILNTFPLFLDSQGNLTIYGSLLQNGLAVSRTPGTDELSYGDKTTENTIEDFGTAQLHGGGADVPLRADFRATMNASQPYMVFLTPHGDNRGLYVASSGPQGFSIRESQGGRSSLTFDYRIVAHPAGALAARLPLESQLKRPMPRVGSGHGMSYAAVRSRILAMRQAHLPHARSPHAPTSLFAIPNH